jgi:phosphoribosyl 1,2-cyclic phosphate phosphodiesterase
MKFTLLGSGTSSGVPMIACDCPTCTSDDPRDQRTRCSALIETIDADGQPRAILIDAGPDLRAQAIRRDLWRCDAILLTHNHVDHIYGLDETRRFNVAMRAPIDVYGDAHTLASAERVFEHIFQPHRSVNKSFVATLVPRVVEEEDVLELFGLRITPIALMHGALPIFGYRIEDTLATSGGRYAGPVAYCTDASHICSRSYPLLEGLDVLFLDALRHTPHPTHLSLKQAIVEAERIGARQTYFLHMAHAIKYSVVEPTLPDGMNLGYDGLSFGDDAVRGRASIEGGTGEPLPGHELEG